MILLRESGRIEISQCFAISSVSLSEVKNTLELVFKLVLDTAIREKGSKRNTDWNFFFFLLEDDMTLHTANNKDVSRKLLELINELSIAAEYKINIQESLSF